MQTLEYKYQQDEKTLQGFMAYQDGEGPKPVVIVAHDWSGCNDFVHDKAILLAKMGYVGFALDMYGDGEVGRTIEEKQALMQPLVDDRELLFKRIKAALDAVSSLPQADKHRVVVIGFCFGGLCALDLARRGTDLKGVVSIHGALTKPENTMTEEVKARVLVLHGYEDPMAKPDTVKALCEEMTQAKADWQVHLYGHVKHAFTNPEANNPALGLMFNATASERAWQAVTNFLGELL